MKSLFKNFMLSGLIATSILSMALPLQAAKKGTQAPQTKPSPSPTASVSPTQAAEKVVYLTFDDGPTPKITEQILDVLNKNGVKATFFVVGKEIVGREDILKKIYEGGHTIGLHTYSHNFKTIYQSPESFIAEMNKTKEQIHGLLGPDVNLSAIRFPGGSAGRLNERFYAMLCDAGYRIYDWNVDLKDGIQGGLSPEQFITNAKKCMDRSSRRIILMHTNSNNINTVKALDGIISYYKSQGFVFKGITEDTKPYYYRFKK